MILFFTGTGNSRYIARRIADSLGDELLNMNERIKAWDTSEITLTVVLFLSFRLTVGAFRALSKSG